MHNKSWFPPQGSANTLLSSGGTVLNLGGCTAEGLHPTQHTTLPLVTFDYTAEPQASIKESNGGHTVYR